LVHSIHIQICVFSLLLKLIKVEIGSCNNLCVYIHCIFCTYVFRLSRNKSVGKPLGEEEHLVARQTQVDRQKKNVESGKGLVCRIGAGKFRREI
jgi:hypothetical protein